MTNHGMPDPIELYEGAMKQTRSYLVGTKASQLNDSTPCTEWNVQALIDHFVGASSFFYSALSGNPAEEQKPGSGNLESFDAMSAKVLEAARVPGTMEKNVPSPSGDMPGGQFLTFAFMDTLIHGWDLAKATGQNTQLDSKLTEPCYAMFRGQGEMLRSSGAVGPEIEVPENATTQAKLLGVLGRKA